MKPQVAKSLEEEFAKYRTEDFDHLRLSRGILATPDGGVPLKKLGEGAFAKVYRETTVPGDVYAFTDDDTFDKEIFSFAHDDLPENPHLPAVEKIGHTHDKTVYKMPFYESPLRKGDVVPSGWQDFRKLEKCRSDVAFGPAAHKSGYERMNLVNECAEREAVTPAVREALETLTSTASNYSAEYNYEFTPRNLATDEKGNLVLLDVIFDEEKLRKIRREQEKARERKRLEAAWRKPIVLGR